MNCSPRLHLTIILRIRTCSVSANACLLKIEVPLLPLCHLTNDYDNRSDITGVRVRVQLPSETIIPAGNADRHFLFERVRVVTFLAVLSSY